MKRGFLNSSKAYSKDNPVVPCGSTVQPVEDTDTSRCVIDDLAELSKQVGGLRRKTASVQGYTPAALDFISKDTNQNYKDSDWIISTLPSTPDAIVDGQTVCLITDRAKRQILNMPGYPQPLPCPAQPDCFRIEEIPGKGKGLVATKDMKWGDLIFAERPMIINPTGLPVNCNKLDIPSHFTRPQIQQVGLHEGERQIELLIKELSTKDQVAFRDLWNCHKEDGSGPLLGVSRTNGFNVPDLREPLKPGFPERAGNYSGTWKLISRLNHSCRANIGARWDSSSFSMHVYAGRDIKRGEELCLSYLGVTLQPTASRQCDLRSYGFECTCPACANDASSDARCKEIGVVTDSQWFLSGSSLKVTMKQQKDAIERAIALMEAEGLQLAGQYGNLLLRMSQVCGASQDQGRERKYKKMYETFCRVTLKK